MRLYKWINGCLNGLVYRWTDERTMDRWLDRWVDEWMTNGSHILVICSSVVTNVFRCSLGVSFSNEEQKQS